MKTILGLLLLVALTIFLALPAMAERPQGAARLNFAGEKMPKVDFAHETHKQVVKDCKACHHMGVGNGKCIGCHGSDSRARSKKKAFHDSCRGCHKAKQVSNPKNCSFCHKG